LPGEVNAAPICLTALSIYNIILNTAAKFTATKMKIKREEIYYENDLSAQEKDKEQGSWIP
jgi:hypothetical protein